jgi:hypothetical protein
VNPPAYKAGLQNYISINYDPICVAIDGVKPLKVNYELIYDKCNDEK